jgi:hypothetical protein
MNELLVNLKKKKGLAHSWKMRKIFLYIPLKGYYPRYITHASSCIKGADIANVSDS